MELPVKKIFEFVLFLIILVLAIVLIYKGVVGGFDSVFDIGGSWIEKI